MPRASSAPRRPVKLGFSPESELFVDEGESSGHRQKVKQILYDCDQDALLILVEQTGWRVIPGIIPASTGI